MTKARSNATAPNAKGTLVVGNGTDASTTLAVASTAGYLLSVDSAEATGLKWVAPAAGGGMTLLNSGGTALSGASTTVSITPTGYVALKIYIKGAYASADTRIFMRLNSDTGGNYSYTVTSTHLTTNSSLPGDGTTSFEYITRGCPTTNDISLLANADIDLQFPNDTDFVTIQYQSIGGAAVGTFWQQSGGGVYDGTAAITGITFGVPTGTFSGGTIYVYGVK